MNKEEIMSEKMASKEVTIAEANNQPSPETYFGARESLLRAAKQAVGKYVVDKLLHEGDSILLDAGTSSYPIAEEIAKKAQQEPASTHYTIMTHNYKAFDILVRKVPREAMVNIVLAGGRYDQDLNALFGPQTTMSYDNFFPRVAIIAVSSMVADKGLFCHGNTEELAVKQLIFKKAARDRIIIADHSKLGVPDALCFGESQHLLANVERCFLVTDSPDKGADEKTWTRFQQEIERLTNIYRVKVELVKNNP
jgi:DeoR/GlpR family transcriptional regulator of sugar metabolism